MRRVRRVLVGAVVCLLVVLFPIAAVVTEADALAPAQRQLLLVSASPADPTRATVRALEWTGHRWRLTFPAMSARLGRSGVTADPHEADGATPVGTYSVDLAFGTGDAPGGALPYRHVTNDDHWVDDPASPLYNTWQTGEADGRWESAEDLDGYTLAVAFDFNQHPVTADGNSAIFLHAGPNDEASAGCVTVASDDLSRIVWWLTPALHPRIEIGVQARPPQP